MNDRWRRSNSHAQRQVKIQDSTKVTNRGAKQGFRLSAGSKHRSTGPPTMRAPSASPTEPRNTNYRLVHSAAIAARPHADLFRALGARGDYSWNTMKRMTQI